MAKKKTFTFLITSNRKSKTKSLTFSSRLLLVFSLCSFAVVVFISSMIIDYVGLLLEAGENKRLKAENASLKKQFEVVELKINSLENSLERVKSFSTKLKLITDVDNENRTLNLALGKEAHQEKNINKNNIDEKKERSPSSTTSLFNKMFLGDQMSDKKSGEILSLNINNYKTLSIRVDQNLKRSQLQEQGVIDLYNKLSKHNTYLTATPTIKPTKGWYTAKFGYRMDPFSGKPIMHNGVDIAAPEGTPVLAPASGMVAHIGYESGYGKVLTIDHGFGLKTRYAHNSQIFVEIGQRVTKKEMISAVGNTGRSQGPHLYYEVRVHGIPVDPINFIIE